MECAKEPVRLLFHEDVCVSRSAVYLNKTDLLKKEKMEKECDDEDQAAMHFIDVPVDNTCCPQIDYTASPGGIYEEDVVRFCQQILSGLCHLHTLKVIKELYYINHELLPCAKYTQKVYLIGCICMSLMSQISLVWHLLDQESSGKSFKALFCHT